MNSRVLLFVFVVNIQLKVRI